jgi:hypothetical protein
MGLLARCGVATGVLLSTCGRLDRRAQEASIVHDLSPASPRLIPSRCPGPPGRKWRYPGLQQGLSVKGLVNRGIDVRAPWFEARARSLTHPGPGRLERSRGDEISPTCAHSWGQLLDLSTLVTIRRTMTTRRHPAAVLPSYRRTPVDKSTRRRVLSRRVWAGGLRAGVTQRLGSAGERHLAAVSSGGRQSHCRARLLMRAVSSVTWV